MIRRSVVRRCSALLLSLVAAAALSLACVTPAWAAGETINDAISIKPNETDTFTISDNFVDRWYVVNLPSDGIFSVNVTHIPGQRNWFWVNILNAQGDEVDSISCDASDGVHDFPRLGLPKGTYYIQVEPNYNDAFECKLTTSFTATSNWETELNDSAATADSISLGKAVNGAYMDEFDDDWYTFTLAEDTDVELTFSNKLYGSGDVYLYLFSSESTSTSKALWDAWHEMEDASEKSGRLELKRGTYYVRVYPNYNTSGQEYSLTVSKAPTTQTMYRLYNPYTGEHFYTANAGERDTLRSIGWTYEGVGWVAPLEGDPVYRLFNPYTDDHHYTTSASERDALKGIGWRYEGVGWCSGGSVPVLRQFNPYVRTATHNYTVSREENDKLVSIGWREEGTGWYAVSAK